jgi:hypothetical protein
MLFALSLFETFVVIADEYVDREARKGKGPSDHAPIVTDFSET